MARQRAQAFIIQNDKMLFGYGHIKGRGLGHFFIGGGVEENETPDKTVIREIFEETNTHAKIIFKLSSELKENHHTYLVDIGDQETTLGYDPEEILVDSEMKSLQQLIWIDLTDISKFTQIDLDYIKLLIQECKTRNITPVWLDNLYKIINK